VLLLQKPRTRQPLEDGRVDWGAPICRGLVAVQHYAAANYQAFNGDVFPIEVGADVRRTPQSGLICLRHPSWFSFTGSISIPRVNGYVGSTSVLSVFIPGTNAVASNVACLGGSAGHIVVSTVSGTTATITATFRGVAGTVGGTDTSLPYLAPYTTVARNIQAAEQSLWINGKKDPVTLAGTATSFSAATIGNVASCRSGLALNAYFLRDLSDSEIDSLSDNPWQIFEPRRIWVPVSVSGGGATVDVPAGALTLTGYAPTVSVPRSVSVPAAALTLTGYPPTISTPRSISVPAGAITLTGFAPTVTTTASGATINVPTGTLTLTSFAPSVSIPAAISVPAGSLTLTGYAPTVTTTAGTRVDVPAGALTLTGYAPTVYYSGSTTTSILNLPLRVYADGAASTVEPTSALDNLRSLLPAQRSPVVNADRTMSSDWYRFFDFMVNVYLDSLSQPTVADIVSAVETTLAQATANAETTTLIAQQAQANAEALASVVQVVQTEALPGSDQIPPVSMSYLEP
jgi:hypothetical protein